MVAIGEHRLGDGPPPVEKIHDKQEIGQKGQHKSVDLLLCSRKEQADGDGGRQHRQQNHRQLFRRFGQQLGMALHEQLVEIGITRLMAGLAQVGFDLLLIGLHGHLGGVHGVHGKGVGRQERAVDRTVSREAEDVNQRESPGNHHRRRQRPENHAVHRPAQRRQSVRRDQRQSHSRPHHRRGEVIASYPLPIPTGTQQKRRVQQLHPTDEKGHQQAGKDGHPAEQAEQEGEGQEAHRRLEQKIQVVGKGIRPGIHPHEEHGVILILGGVENVGVQQPAGKGEEKEDVNEGIRRGAFHPSGRQKNHQQQIQRLAQKKRADFQQDTDHVGKDLQARAGIKGIGQQPLDQGDRLERIKDAVGLIGVPQLKRGDKGVNHGLLPSAPR